MKLFIWQGEDVLVDYTSGMIVAIAPTLEEALKTIESQEGKYIMNEFPTNKPSQVIDLGENVKQVQNEAWITWGGG